MTERKMWGFGRCSWRRVEMKGPLVWVVGKEKEKEKETGKVWKMRVTEGWSSKLALSSPFLFQRRATSSILKFGRALPTIEMVDYKYG